MTIPRHAAPIPPPARSPARYCDLPLPPYRFVPGRCPHPHRDPEGHGGGLTADTPDEVAFRYGVDLFNARFYWEAHEAWETVWRRAAAGSPEHHATKGLIQITASLLTLFMGRVEASRALAARGALLLDRASHGVPRYRGLRLAEVARLARQRVVEPSVPGPLDAAAFFIALEPPSA